MRRSSSITTLILMILVAGSSGPGPGSEASGQALRGISANETSLPTSVDSSSVEDKGDVRSVERNRLLLHPVRYDPTATTLTFAVRRNQTANRLLGYNYYRASTMQCTMEGAGLGASIGLMAGAFGEMTGAWNERTSWALGGAMAALGAFYGGKVRADDPGWSLRIRWDDPHKIEPLEYNLNNK